MATPYIKIAYQKCSTSKKFGIFSEKTIGLNYPINMFNKFSYPKSPFQSFLFVKSLVLVIITVLCNDNMIENIQGKKLG